MDKPKVRANFVWKLDEPTHVAPLPGHGGCVVVRATQDSRGGQAFQVDLFVGAGQGGTYVKKAEQKAFVVDLAEGAMVPSDPVLRSLPFNIGDPPPPHPPIGPDDIWLLWNRFIHEGS
jgi:hypothetical protein